MLHLPFLSLPLRFHTPRRLEPFHAILRHLQDYGSITQAEAVTEYGCYRLGALDTLLYLGLSAPEASGI